jgi:hypothetical protein
VVIIGAEPITMGLGNLLDDGVSTKHSSSRLMQAELAGFLYGRESLGRMGIQRRSRLRKPAVANSP